MFLVQQYTSTSILDTWMLISYLHFYHFYIIAFFKKNYSLKFAYYTYSSIVRQFECKYYKLRHIITSTYKT